MFRSILCVVLLLVSTSAYAQDLGLVGGMKTRIELGVAPGDLPVGFTEDRLYAIIKKELNEVGGVRVLTQAEDTADPDIIPVTRLEVTAIPARITMGGAIIGTSYYLSLRVSEYRKTPRNGRNVGAALYTGGWLRWIASTDDTIILADIEKFVTDLGHKLGEAWKSANATSRAN